MQGKAHFRKITETYNLASVEGILDMAAVVDECDMWVHFQPNLQCGKHVTTICAKASKTVRIINHTFFHISADVF